MVAPPAQIPGVAYIDPRAIRRIGNQRWAQWTKDSLMKGAGPLRRRAKRAKADGVWSALRYNSTSCTLDPVRRLQQATSDWRQTWS